MRTLISNLNVIRDTRICGDLRNGFDRISAVLADLAGQCLGITSVTATEMPAIAGIPVSSVFGKPLYVGAGIKPEADFAAAAMFAGHESDQPCPWHLRLLGQSPLSERPVIQPSLGRQRSSERTIG
jgi:hypothetical protein